MTKKKRAQRMTLAMRLVIETMQSGSGYWEAVHTGGFGAGAFIQEGKIGYGGKSQRIRSDTFHALYKRGVFVQATGGTQWEKHYKLAPKYAPNSTTGTTTGGK